MFKGITFAIVLLFAIIACEKNVDPALEEEAIRKVASEVVASWNENDFEKYMFHFDDDAIMFLQDGPAVKGIEALKSLYQNSFNNLTLNLNALTEEITVHGDYAFEVASWAGTMNPKDGSNAINFDNKVMCIYKKQIDGTWKMYRCMYNSNKPKEK